jgi:hypothetical protein
MEWNRSNAIGLALASCTLCEGHGMVELIRGGAEKPCDCVFRAIFRACYRRFRECAISGTQMGSVSLECTHGPLGKHFYSRKREEYIADFHLLTRRVLTDFEYTLFRYTFLLGADWTLTAPRLNLDKGNFFHLLYRMEEKLGHEYCEVQPYPLYPLDEYFGGRVTGKKIVMPRRKIRLRQEVRENVPMVRRRDPGMESIDPYRFHRIA